MCNIKKKNDGLDKISPKYYLNVFNNNRILITAKKNLNTYEFSYDKDENESSDNIIGRMHSNFIGTIFNLYNEGKDPKDIASPLEIRHQYGCITYVY